MGPLSADSDVLSQRALATDLRVLAPPGVGGGTALADDVTGDATVDGFVTAVATRLLTLAGLPTTAHDGEGGTPAGGDLTALEQVLRGIDGAGGSATPDPVGGTPPVGGYLLRLLRRAAGTTSDEPPTQVEAAALVDSIDGLLAVLTGDGSPFPLQQIIALHRGPPSDPTVPDQLTTDERNLYAAEGAALAESDADQAGGGPRPHATGMSKLVDYLGQEVRSYLRFAWRMSSQDIGTRHESGEGTEVHELIQSDYRTRSEHAGHQMLTDDTCYPAAGAPFPLSAATTAPWLFLRAALATPAGGTAEPDILDVDLHEVYEIKPLADMMGGYAQLWLRYLLPLNAAEKGSSFVVGQFDAALAAWVGSLTSDGTSTASPPSWTTWKPGRWRPAPVYLTKSGEVVAAELIVPGLIVYQKLEKEEGEDLVAAFHASILLLGAALRAAQQKRQQGSSAEPEVVAARGIAALAVAQRLIRPEVVTVESGGHEASGLSVAEVALIIGGIALLFLLPQVALLIAADGELALPALLTALRAMSDGTLQPDGGVLQRG